MKIPTSYRNLRIDVEHHTVYRGKDMISLTHREYDLLATLMGEGNGDTVSYWKVSGSTRVQVRLILWTSISGIFVGKLIYQVKKSYIKTVRGIGYAMQDALE